jgi:hypothetical protein
VPKADINNDPLNILSVSAHRRTAFHTNEAQVADDFIAAAMVRRMIDAVDHRHFGKIKRAHAFQAGDVDTVLVEIGTAAMVGVDAAFRTKIMLRHACVEPINLSAPLRRRQT